MAGGRPTIPLNQKKLDGSFRGDRHGKPSGAMATATGLPKMPTGLDKVGREMWEFVCRERKNWLATSDARSLEDLCNLWSLRAKAKKLADAKPADKDARCSFLGYQAAAAKLMGHFGLDPDTRGKLGEIDPGNIDPAAEFIA